MTSLVGPSARQEFAKGIQAAGVAVHANSLWTKWEPKTEVGQVLMNQAREAQGSSATNTMANARWALLNAEYYGFAEDSDFRRIFQAYLAGDATPEQFKTRMLQYLSFRGK